MSYYGNSTAGADQGQDIPDDGDDGWECPHCGEIFWTASAWSEDDGNTPGMLCPECGEFISNEELGIEEKRDADISRDSGGDEDAEDRYRLLFG